MVALAHADPPVRPSSAGLRAVLGEAIERARHSEAIPVLGRAVGHPGYRRQLLDRFAAWTRDERPVDGPAPGESPVAIEEWTLFGHYRATLRAIGAEDADGWAVWASRAMARTPPPALRKLGQVVVLDPIEPTRAGWRLLDLCHKRARSMDVILPFEHDPALAELYSPVDPARRQFLGWGFVEEAERSDGFSFRPPGPEAVERELFRSDASDRPRWSRAEGLRILGGPQGEGLGLLVAREVRDRVDEGVPPEEILILVPRMDGQADRIREALRSWGLPVDPGGERRLASVAAVSALRLAMQLPVDHWEVATLVRLLRNGRIRWPEGPTIPKFARFEAASAIRSTRVFRDRSTLRQALVRALEDDAKSRPARIAIEALDRLSGLIDPIALPGPWRAQVDRLGRLVDGLGLDSSGLDPLRDALEGRGWVLEALGPAIAEETISWADFVAQVVTVIAEADPLGSESMPGTIRIESVDAARGVRARVVILANLGERTFPAPDAIDIDSPPGGGGDTANLAYAREMLRFARVAGSASDRLVLAYPTTDLKGEKLLPAGFLDELLGRLDGGARSPCVVAHGRFDPVLADHPRLAEAPADARVLAVALACRDEGTGRLRELAADPGHARALVGTADAFEVAHRRREERAFGPYDGRLRDPGAIARIRDDFGAARAFSPSQLESFALCPFQFFQRYVLGLKVVDERQELEEDYAGRGSDVHRVLEQIHQQIASEPEPGTDLLGRLSVLIETGMRVELEQHDGTEADVAQVLREIGTMRTNKALGRYLGQFRDDARRLGVMPEPHRFEVVFGQPHKDETYPHLAIGEGDDAVGLMGTIDRIDLIRKGGKVLFRVIDYKTGSNPARADVLSGLATQLPLYALAAERLVLLPPGDFEFSDVGYWSLPKDGYKSVKFDDWSAYRARLTDFVLALVAELRSGMFPIDSRKKDCRKFCDFQATCRVAEVRSAGKVWDDRPSLEADP